MVKDRADMNIKNICQRHNLLVRALAGESAGVIGRMAEGISKCFLRGGVVFACGNGGSASQAEHFAGELLGRFGKDRRPLAACALSQNAASLTAISNDYSYSWVYARQIEGLGKRGDCLLVLSTSGESENIVQACRAAKSIGMRVFALTGEVGGRVASESHIVLRVPDSNTARIQEVHLVALHMICELVEQRFFSPAPHKEEKV